MSRDTKFSEVLRRWHALRAQGQTISAEELCHDCPEWTEDFRRLLAILQDVQTQEKQLTFPLDLDLPPHVPQLPDTLVALSNPCPALGHPFPGAEPVPGYQLQSWLGRGGYGEVWKAIGPGGFSVALKFIHLDDRTGTLEQRALELMKDIRHPHLLPTFGAWQTGGYLVLALELADRTLADRQREAVAAGLPGIPFDELLEYMQEAAKGIDYLNEPRHRFQGKEGVGIQHRDIKPQNLFLVGGCIKVADFGLAKLLERAVISTTGSMTPAYAAPELIQGRVSAYSDQYSLAITYCEMRSGRLPFSGHPAQVLLAHVLSPPDLSMLPAEEQPAVARALAKQPDERWPSCKAFVKALAEPARPPAPATPAPIKSEKAKSAPQIPPAEVPLEPASGAVRIELDQSAADVMVRVDNELIDLARLHEPLRLPVGEHELQVSGGDYLPLRQPFAVRPGANVTVRVKLVHKEAPLSALGRLEGHKDTVWAVAFASDGQRAVSASEDKTLRIWDIVGIRKLRTLRGHDAGVHGVTFTPDGRRLLSCGLDRSIRLWDADTGAELCRFAKCADICWSVAMAADGAAALTTVVNEIRLWELATESELKRFQGHTGLVRAAVFSPLQDAILSGSEDRSMRLWDRARGIELSRFEGHEGAVRSVAFAPDGRRLLSASADKTIRLWDAGTGQLLRVFKGHTDAVRSVAFAPNGQLVLSGGADGTVRLWQVDTGRELRCLEPQQGQVWSVAFAPNKRRALSAGDDAIVLWRLPRTDKS
jgi:WD40 repeat protein